jgi:hypothetical protein
MWLYNLGDRESVGEGYATRNASPFVKPIEHVLSHVFGSAPHHTKDAAAAP